MAHIGDVDDLVVGRKDFDRPKILHADFGFDPLKFIPGDAVLPVRGAFFGGFFAIYGDAERGGAVGGMDLGEKVAGLIDGQWPMFEACPCFEDFPVGEFAHAGVGRFGFESLADGFGFFVAHDCGSLWSLRYCFRSAFKCAMLLAMA